MQETNELNDIILNKNNSGNNNKKIVLAVATLGIILILVVVLMNSITSSGTDNLPQAILPPEPTSQSFSEDAKEPLFEEVPVVNETSSQANQSLDDVAQKIKQESQEEVGPEFLSAEEPVPVVAEKKEVVKQVAPKKVIAAPTPVANPVAKTVTKKTTTGSHFIQVGSFSKYAPNKTFLKSITDKGYNYEFHEVTVNGQTISKVLVGPFSNDSEARDALSVIRKNIEAGAFITKI